MPRPKRVIASDLTIAELKRLLAVKEHIAPLQEKKAKLEAELEAVNAELAQLGAIGKPAVRRDRKPGPKPGRKPGRPATKKAVRRAAKKGKAPARKKARRGGTPREGTLTQVVAKVIRAHGKPMAFQDILKTIKKEKLYKTKAADFANVLRRTISGSKAFKRVARATYGV